MATGEVEQLCVQIDRALLGRLSAVQGDTDALEPEVAELVQRLRETGSSPVEAELTDPDRLRVIEDSGLASDQQHPEIDRLMHLAAEAMGTPVAVLSVVTDTVQVLVGMAGRSAEDAPKEWPLTHSMCVYPVITRQPTIIDDTEDHSLFCDHPATKLGMRAYIGIPIDDGEGHVIGALCAWNFMPHHWSSGQVQILSDLALVAQQQIFGSDS